MDELVMQSQKMTVRRLPEMNCLMDLTASKSVPLKGASNPSTTYKHEKIIRTRGCQLLQKAIVYMSKNIKTRESLPYRNQVRNLVER